MQITTTLHLLACCKALSGSIFLEGTDLKSVSYTHLDVYKRQAAPYNGRLSGRQATVWEAGQGSLLPPSLFAAQVAERDKRHSL